MILSVTLSFLFSTFSHRLLIFIDNIFEKQNTTFIILSNSYLYTFQYIEFLNYHRIYFFFLRHEIRFCIWPYIVLLTMSPTLFFVPEIEDNFFFLNITDSCFILVLFLYFCILWVCVIVNLHGGEAITIYQNHFVWKTN